MSTYHIDAIRDEMDRAMWEVRNVIACTPDALWDKCYCKMPLWKHIYHMLHSLDQWYINPFVYTQPPFHEKNLNNLDIETEKRLSREELRLYFAEVKHKIAAYNASLTDEMLLQTPENCRWNRFTLILAQSRHLHSHMGMIMGFIIVDTGLWPKTLGLELPIPEGEYGSYS